MKAALLLGLCLLAVQSTLGEDTKSDFDKLGATIVRDASLPGNPIISVDLTGCATSNEKLQCLGGVPSLRTLDL